MLSRFERRKKISFYDQAKKKLRYELEKTKLIRRINFYVFFQSLSTTGYLVKDFQNPLLLRLRHMHPP